VITSATARQRRLPWAQRALGLFVVVWLNVAVQPCAIAMVDDEDHNCPHCPPEHSVHHDAALMPVDGNAMPCMTGELDCSGLDDVNHDGRFAQLKLKDVPSDGLAVIGTLSDGFAVPRLLGDVAVVPTRGPPSGVAPALNVLYCVYLI
jgi:hypothetical protein